MRVAEHSSSLLKASRVKAFSFHIDPVARFEESGKRIRKSRLNLALQFRLPALKVAARAIPKPEPQPALRKAPPKFVNSEKEILAARQTRYGTFMISTMQQRDGRWTASLGCADGRPLIVDGGKQAVSITNPYLSESLALAEAQLRVDALGIV